MIGPQARSAGHGTLAYNMRGQADSPFSPGLKLDMNLIVEDASRLLTELNPLRPILVGLSIGGLFAATTWLTGADAMGLVLINTLRKDGPRLRWIGDALVRAVELGGTCTGEHGVGIGKRKFMHQEHGESFELMRQIKTLIDPKGLMNPGKIFM